METLRGCNCYFILALVFAWKMSIVLKILSILCFIGSLSSWSKTLRLDYIEFEQHVLAGHPILKEDALNVAHKELQLRQVEYGAILPKLDLDMGMGPAPGLKLLDDYRPVVINGRESDSMSIKNQSRTYDFSNWGPTFGMQARIAQPLNLYRYRAGHLAAKLNIAVAKDEFYKQKMQISKESQEIYFGWIYSAKMMKETSKALNDFSDAEEKMEEMLDDEEEGISQKDLLKLRANLFQLQKGYNEAKTGYQRAQLGARFFLFLADTIKFQPKDTVLSKIPVHLPSLDSLKMLLIHHHPDLRRLANGLSAREELIKVAKGELGPDIFLFGGFDYTKTWSRKRESGGKDAFTKDPLNDLSGVGGLGFRLRLNLWARNERVKKAKLELKQLQRKEVYATRALLMLLEEAYIQVKEAESNVSSASNSLRAAEAWLKGAAMAYDLDPSQAKEMITPYKEVLEGKRNFFEAVYLYNQAVAKVIYCVGWTLSDFLTFNTKN